LTKLDYVAVYFRIICASGSLSWVAGPVYWYSKCTFANIL